MMKSKLILLFLIIVTLNSFGSDLDRKKVANYFASNTGDDSPADSAVTIFDEGVKDYNDKKYHTAIKKWHSVLPYFFKNNRKVVVITGYDNIGLAYWGLNDKALAFYYFDKALQLALKENLEESVYGEIERLTLNYENIGLIQKSIDYYKIGKKFAFDLKDTAYYGTYIRAISSLSDSIALYRHNIQNYLGKKIEKPSDTASVRKLIDIGTKLFQAGEIKLALEYYKESFLFLLGLKYDSPLFLTTYKSMISGFQVAKILEIPLDFNLGAVLENRENVFRLKNLEQIGGELIAELAEGSEIFIQPGMKGTVVGADIQDMEGHRTKYIGEITVLESKPFYSKLSIKPKSTEGNLQVQLSDFAQFNLPASFLGDTVYLSNVSSQIVNLYDSDNFPYLDRYLFYYIPEPQIQYKLNRIMASEAIVLGEAVKKKIDDLPAWKDVMQGGYYGGKSLVEKVAKSDAEDLRRFWAYLRDFPGNYTGLGFNMVEAYAGWVLSDGIIGQSLLTEMFLNANSKKDIIDIYNVQKEHILKQELIPALSDTVYEYVKRKDFVKADRIALGVVETALMIKNDTVLASAFFAKGQSLHAQKKYREAIDAFQTAIPFYEKIEYWGTAGSCYHNIGLCLDGINDFPAAAKNYDKAIEARIKSMQKYKTDDSFESLGSTLWAKAYSLSQAENNDAALKSYLISISYYDSSKSQHAVLEKMTVMSNIGSLYNKQGKDDLAAEIYGKVLVLAQTIKDSDRISKAYQNVAYAFFSLSSYDKAIENYRQGYDEAKKIGNKADMGFCQSNIGQAYWNLGKYDEAIAAHNEAIKLKAEVGDLTGLGYSWNMLGSLYRDSGDPNKAQESYDKSLSFYEQAVDTSGRAKVYDNEGQLAQNQKNYEKAIKYYKLSLELYKSLSDRFAIAEATYNLGLAFMNYGEYDNAEEFLKKSYELRKILGDQSGQIYSLVNLGYVEYWLKTKFDAAKDIFSEALNLAKAVGSQTNIGYCYWNMGKLYLDKGRTKRALVFLDSAITIYAAIQDKAREGSALIDIASAYMQVGNFDSCAIRLMSALKIAETTNNRDLEAGANMSYTNLYSFQGEYKKAKELLDKTKVIYSEVGNQWGESSLSVSYGNLYNTMGEYKEAMKYYNVSDSLYSLLKDEYNRATPVNNIGTIYYWQGDYPEALEKFKTALASLDKVSFRGEFFSMVISNIAEVYFELKDYTKAKIWADSALHTSRATNSKRTLGSTLALLANINIENDLPDSAKAPALEAYTLSKQIGEKSKIISIALILGKMYYTIKDTTNSRIYLDEAIAISKELESDKYLYQALLYKALLYKDRKKPDETLANLKEAIASLDRIKGKISGGEKALKIFTGGELKVKIYANIISAFIEKGLIDSAFYYIEKSNSDAIKAQFSRFQVTPKDKEQAQALEQEKDLKKKVEGLQNEYDKENAKPDSVKNKEKLNKIRESQSIAQKDYAGFLNTTVNKYPGLAKYLKDTPKSFTQSNESIPADIAVIYYLLGEDQLYIFVAKKDSVNAKVVKIGKAELEKKVVKFYRLLKDSYIPQALGEMNPVTFLPVAKDRAKEEESYLKPYNEGAKELYDLLIKPVISDINHKKNIAIIPFGKLYYLPFETIIESGANSNNVFFLQNHSIFYVNSLANVTGMQKDSEINIKISAFGNADNSLPKAEIEVEDIQKLYKDAEIYIRDKATIDRVRNLTNKFNVLHLATHGSLDYVDNSKSFLSMAKSNDSVDGKLTIDIVWSMINLKGYNLVTLSACKTAVSDETVEDWMVNPAVAFFDVGVRTVVASLWKVDDEATAILMQSFYSNLKTMTKLDALQKAKIEMSKNPKYAYPYYWGAFILVGNYK